MLLSGLQQGDILDFIHTGESASAISVRALEMGRISNTNAQAVGLALMAEIINPTLSLSKRLKMLETLAIIISRKTAYTQQVYWLYSVIYWILDSQLDDEAFSPGLDILRHYLSKVYMDFA